MNCLLLDGIFLKDLSLRLKFKLCDNFFIRFFSKYDASYEIHTNQLQFFKDLSH